MHFYAPFFNEEGVYCFWPVCLSLCVSVPKLKPRLKFGHIVCNIDDSNLIFVTHVYLMELQILSGERSRSSFKVKSQKTQSQGSNKL